MLERARTQAQLEKIQSSILMIDMHRSTIEGAAVDLSVFEALKASGDTLRQMGATKEGLGAVDEFVQNMAESMQSAADITTALSSDSVTGMLKNSMAAYGVVVDEDELMRELDSMTLEGEEDGPASAADAAVAVVENSKEEEKVKPTPANTAAGAVEPARARHQQKKATANKEKDAGEMLAF